MLCFSLATHDGEDIAWSCPFSDISDNGIDLTGDAVSGGSPCALLFREGLMPYAEVTLGSKRLCLSARRGTVLAFLAATASTLLAFYLTFVGAYSVLTPLSLLVYLLLWSLSVLVDGMLSDRY